jgi:hypothetical protein
MCQQCEPSPVHDQIRDDFENRKLRFIGMGGRRATYLSPSGKFVYKVPINLMGVRDNKREHELYRTKEEATYWPHERLARCRLAPSGVLVMEVVSPTTRNNQGCNYVNKTEDRPDDWISKRWVDGQQYGKNRAGNWVAYDYGCE